MSGYIVDDYSATAAYSLRKLSSSATNSIRVRRSSDNAEQDIGFTGDALDTTSLASFVGANSGYIVTWYDQSNSNDVTNATASAQPRIVNAGTIDTKGSLPAVKFDGTNDTLNNFSSAFINIASVSYFSVSASGATSVFSVIHSQDTSNSTIRTFCDARTTPYRNLVVSGGTSGTWFADLSTARNDTNQRLLSSFIDASKNMSAFDNSATGGTDTYTNDPVNTGLTLGRQSTTYGNFYLQEFIAFNTDESANRTDIETNINTYYGIY